MKIRNGFISNSSSSNFVIIGEKISAEEAKKSENVFTVTNVLSSEGFYAKFNISNDDIDKLELATKINVEYYNIAQNLSNDNTLDIDAIVSYKNNNNLKVISGVVNQYWDIERIIEVNNWRSESYKIH